MSKYDYKRIYNKIEELIDNSESFIDLSTEDNDIWLDDIEVLNMIKDLIEDTKVTIKSCIGLLDLDGINSKQIVKIILKSLLKKYQ